MKAKYLPIFKAKAGEFKAIANATASQARCMLPLFEVSRIGKSVREAKRFKGCKELTCAYLDEVAEDIAKIRTGKTALIDAFQWAADACTETGEHVIPYIHAQLQAHGVETVPVIGYDRWDSHSYQEAIQNIKLASSGYYCLRLDSHAIEDASEPEYFDERISEILDTLDLEPKRCGVLIDFGDVTALSVEKLLDQAEAVMEVVGTKEFKFFSTAACSLPPTIDAAVKKHNTTGFVARKEMLLWQALRSSYPKIKWLFGDYGVRGPNSAEDVITPDANGKIRHTVSKKYFVTRGQSIRTGDKGKQMHRLAKAVTESEHYMGEGFSWGDAQILACSRFLMGPGNSTSWIAIDTNHHIAWVVAEIEEFELRTSMAEEEL